MSIIQVGLVDATGEIDPSLVQATAVALNIQVVQDLPKYWPVTASVQYLSDPKQIPVGVWPIFLVASLPPGEGGFHMDEHNQPYAKVIASADSAEWTIDASHELVEMLVDPYGNKMQTSQAIQISGNDVIDADGQFSYLVEAADPCEADPNSYQIHGISVSDFITPNFYDAVLTSGTNYSFTGKIQRPRQVLPGGYISYVDLATNEWQQILWVDPSQPPQLKDLGPSVGQGSSRLWIDSKMAEYKAQLKTPIARDASVQESSRSKRQMLNNLALARGRRFGQG